MDTMDPQKYKEELLKALFQPYMHGIDCPFGGPDKAKVVCGEGNSDADLMFIGEGPGKEEDKQGRPFVGRSGLLLNRALSHVEIERPEVYITNIVKCRPPQNRAPTPQESAISMNLFLYNEIKIVRPKIICTLGSIALNNLLGKPCSISRMRGKPLEWQGTLIITTYHPAYILRNQSQAATWLEDFKALKKALTEGKLKGFQEETS